MSQMEPQEMIRSVYFSASHNDEARSDVWSSSSRGAVWRISFLMIKQRRVYYVSELSGHVVVQQSDVSCLLVKSFFDVGHDVEVFNRNTNNQPGRLPRQ